MITKVVIRDSRKSPFHYLSDFENFKNGKEYEFKHGVNVIVGENGCGKTTLMNIIKKYLMVDFRECSRGEYNCNINDQFRTIFKDEGMLDGIDVYADYTKNTFRLSHAGENERYQDFKTFEDIETLMDQKTASTGESVLIAINSLFNYMFCNKAQLTFDYSQFQDNYPQYVEYVNAHRVECADEWTILMDEPDRNLSLENISQIKAILSFHKPNTQIIAVVHNPLLICALSKKGSVNMIEMTDGYVDKVVKEVNNLIR